MVLLMKKYIILLVILLMPIKVLAYSDYIIPGGNTIGIEVNHRGIIVIGFYQINNRFNRGDLKLGDTIIKIGNTTVDTTNELVREIRKQVTNNEITMTIKRGKQVLEIPFTLIKVDGTYKTGLYVKDSVSGIGTLTYIDPETKIFGALGHEITESTTGKLIEVRTGKIYRSSVIKIEKSVRGVVGTKTAKFYSNTLYGTVIKNTNKGLYGTYAVDISSDKVLPVGQPGTLTKGPAQIYTVLKDEEIKVYEINIDKIDDKSEIKNIHFNLVSEELINATGGIIQGMSGSPIIQNGKIYGAVTHVIVDKPTTGYGIFITAMLEEGER